MRNKYETRGRPRNATYQQACDKLRGFLPRTLKAMPCGGVATLHTLFPANTLDEDKKAIYTRFRQCTELREVKKDLTRSGLKLSIFFREGTVTAVVEVDNALVCRR